ncbi:hypothetical protein FB451DRAFT_1506583 [Mycena latifolia]|nr:hypothetical protein FB451DRAFT_1506583 [Mycena latifolia]
MRTICASWYTLPYSCPVPPVKVQEPAMTKDSGGLYNTPIFSPRVSTGEPLASAELWNALPGLFGLPPWEELLEGQSTVSTFEAQRAPNFSCAGFTEKNSKALSQVMVGPLVALEPQPRREAIGSHLFAVTVHTYSHENSIRYAGTANHEYGIHKARLRTQVQLCCAVPEQGPRGKTRELNTNENYKRTDKAATSTEYGPPPPMVPTIELALKVRRWERIPQLISAHRYRVARETGPKLRRANELIVAVRKMHNIRPNSLVNQAKGRSTGLSSRFADPLSPGEYGNRVSVILSSPDVAIALTHCRTISNTPTTAKLEARGVDPSTTTGLEMNGARNTSMMANKGPALTGAG